MDDKFLYQLQEAPDLEFVNSLHKKLAKNCSEPEQRRLVDVYHFIKSKRLVQVIAFLVIGLIAIMAISPARAFVSSLIITIAGQLFEVTEDYPGTGGGEQIIEPQVMSLSDALAIFPYDIQLPTYIPPGYTLNEENVRVYVGDAAGPFANTIEFTWFSDDYAYLILRVSDIYLDAGEIVAPGSVEEVQLDANHSAVLIQGGWDADNKVWKKEYGFRLRWLIDNLTYDLMGTNREQLIEIALSTLK